MPASPRSPVRIESLRSPDEFRRVMRAGRRATSDGVTVHALASSEGPSRLGLAVRADRAVDRNRVKRRIRSLWRELPVPPGFDVTVRTDEAASRLTFQELELHFTAALRRSGVRRS